MKKKKNTHYFFHFALPLQKLFLAICGLMFILGCNPNSDTAPSDDPSDYQVDTSIEYKIQISEPKWIVPSDAIASALPNGIETQIANNNVDIIFFKDRLFLAWRTAPSHFASFYTQIHIVSSVNMGETWDHELTLDIDKDLREPRFLAFNSKLQFIYFEAGTVPTVFAPLRMWRTTRQDIGKWSESETFAQEHEVPWDLKVRNNVAYMTSYLYEDVHSAAPSKIKVFFKSSQDGLLWESVANNPYIYLGGVTETTFEFDEDASLWAVTRNEDGDETGFGSHLCHAPFNNLGNWNCPDKSDPQRYDSPKLFRHGDDIYLISRRDIEGPYDQGLDNLSFADQKNTYLSNYSNRAKRTALYKIDKTEQKAVHILDLPGVGDTACPSIKRTGTHTFLIANYTSPLDDPDITWLQGETSSRGTQIYLLTLSFVAQ